MLEIHFITKTVPLLGGARGGSFMCAEEIKRYRELFVSYMFLDIVVIPEMVTKTTRANMLPICIHQAKGVYQLPWHYKEY